MKNFKRNVAVMGIMMAAIYLTGCSSSIVALNDDENKVVARYIADKLLQNDINYKKTELVYIEPTQAPQEEVPETPAPVQPTDAPVPTEAPVTDNPDTSGEPSDEGDIIRDWSKFFTTDEWSITYSSYDTYKTYPEKSDVYSINASEGNQLLVLFFDVKNLTDKKIKVNLSDYKLDYKLYIGDAGYNPQIAVLENGGLMYLKASIPAGKTEKAELVFEVPKDIKFADMRLDVVKDKDEKK
ncbi:MAG: hypothetical protein K2K09_01380 [Lachnospiraceae bacterium]|nr:hypothetical protein [Lachnospiraceae bacterium]